MGKRKLKDNPVVFILSKVNFASSLYNCGLLVEESSSEAYTDEVALFHSTKKRKVFEVQKTREDSKNKLDISLVDRKYDRKAFVV